jgi:hypothetical protein
MWIEMRDFWRNIRDSPANLRKIAYSAALCALLSAASFGLGRLSVLKEVKVPIQVQNVSATTTTSATDLTIQSNIQFNTQSKEFTITEEGSSTQQENSNISKDNHPATGGTIIGVKTSKKYYYPWCGTIKKLSEKNAIVFESIEAAKSAGYTPAKNCKGLY